MSITINAIFNLSLTITAISQTQCNVYGWGNSNQIYRKGWNTGTTQNAWNPPNQGWDQLSGDLSAAPAASAWGSSDTTSVFGVSYDGQMYHRKGSGTSSSDWESIGGTFKPTYNPCAISMNNNHMSTYGIGQDSQLWYKQYSGSGSSGAWGQWTSLGGTFKQPPTGCSWEDGRMDVVGVGTDGALWHRYGSGSSWSSWSSLGGTFASQPSMLTWGKDHMCSFGVGTNKEIWYKMWSGGAWGSWNSMGGNWASTPAVYSGGLGQMDVWAVSAQDGMVYQNSYRNSQWSGWSNLYGSCKSVPAVGKCGTKVSVMCSGKDKNGMHKQWDTNTNTWYPNDQSWEDLGGDFQQAAPEPGWPSTGASAPQTTLTPVIVPLPVLGGVGTRR